MSGKLNSVPLWNLCASVVSLSQGNFTTEQTQRISQRHREATRYIRTFGWTVLVLLAFSIQVLAQDDPGKRFEKDGLAFDYLPGWELSDQSNPAAQQLTLIDKTLDAQVMIIALRNPIANPKQEEESKTALIEPSITRLLKQYEIAGIKVERVPVTLDFAGAPAEGAQLRFEVDGQPGTTDIGWAVLNKRLVQLFFIRPKKTAEKATVCWDLIRKSLRIEPPAKNGKGKQ